MLPTYLDWVMEAYDTLSSDRSIGTAGPGPIPFTSIVRYAELHDVGDTDYLVQVIRAMDTVYFEHMRAHRESGRRGRGGRSRG